MSMMMHSLGGAGDDDEDVLLPGFRFHPTDEELVGFYLRRKVEKKSLSIELIKQLDIYQYDPWDLPICTSVGDKEWYFFCIRERKYKNSARPNRVTGSGFWKATGIDKAIYSATRHDCIGLKKSLVFYRGSAGKGTKTDWMMHEFRLPVIAKTTNNSKSPITPEAEIWTLCRIFKRTTSYKKYPAPPSCRQIPSMKQSHSYDSSQSSSLEFDNTNRENYKNSFGTTLSFQQNEKKKLVVLNNQTDENKKHGMLSSIMQEPSAVIDPVDYPNHQNYGNEFYRESNWGELGSVVEAVYDRSLVYDYGYQYM